LLITLSSDYLIWLFLAAYNTRHLSYPIKCTSNPWMFLEFLELIGLIHFFTLRIIIVDSFFIASYNLTQKLLLLVMRKQWSANGQTILKPIQTIHVKSVYLLLESFSLRVNDQKWLIYQIDLHLSLINVSVNTSVVRIFI